MANPKRPSLGEIGRAFVTGLPAWRSREATQALYRRLSVFFVMATLVFAGPRFIALDIFPDPPTSVDSEEGVCRYDAALEQPPTRLGPAPTPRPVIAGQPTTLELRIRNSGTCSWDDRLALQRESGSLSEAPQVVSATATTSTAVLTARIPLTAPLQSGVYYSTWRMRAPDGRSFGAPLTFSIITHPDGVDPAYPADPPVTPGNLITFIALALPGALGFGLALFRSGRLVAEFYSLKTDSRGLVFVLRRMFNLGPGVSATLKNGEREVEDKHEVIDKIGGPGWLSVHGGTAALLERGGGFSRIVGPGTTRLGTFERVRAVIDLRQLNRKKTESAYTKDGIEVKAETMVSFKLMAHKDGEHVIAPAPKPSWVAMLKAYLKPSWWDSFKAFLGKLSSVQPRPPQPPSTVRFSHQAIREFVYELPTGAKWDETVSSGLGDVIPKKMLDELWAPEDSTRNPRKEIIEELLHNVKAKQRKNGIELIDLTIGPLEVMDKSVDAQRREFWRANWDKVWKFTQAEGEAEALRYTQAARAEAQAELIQAIAQSFRMMALSGTAQPSRLVALKLLAVIARTMKAKLHDATAEKVVLILEGLQGGGGS